jgi:hypothetical protein
MNLVTQTIESIEELGENKVHPSRPAHQSKKQMVGMNGFTHNSLKTKTLVRPAGFEPATSCLEVA